MEKGFFYSLFIAVILLLSSCNSSKDSSLQESLGVLPPQVETSPDTDDTTDDEPEEIDTFVIFGGNYQTVSIGGVAGVPLSILVRNEDGDAVENELVSFTVIGGNTYGTLSSPTAITNASGIAQVTFTSGSQSGNISITAQAIQGSDTFALTATSGSNYQIARAASASGNGQTGNIDSDLTNPFKVLLTDQDSLLPVQGVSIRFISIGARLGDFSGSIYADVVTDANGYATSPTFTLGTLSGSYTVRAYPVADSSTNVDFTSTAVVSSSATIDATNTTISLSNSIISADGLSTTEFTIEIRDENGNLIPNASLPIIVTDSGLLGSTWSVGGWIYSSTGTYTRTLTSGTTTGTISFPSITVDGVGVTTTPTVTISANSSIVNNSTDLSASSASMIVNGSNIVVIATLKNSLNQDVALSGQTLVLSTTAGTLLGSSMTYHAPSGTYRQNLIPPSSTGTATVSLDTINSSIVTGVDLSIPIIAGVPSLSYSASSGKTGTTGSAMSITPSTLENNGAAITQCTIKPGSANAGSWPGTLSINASTCAITGTPTVSLSSTTFTVVATNSAGTSSDATISLIINATNPILSYASSTGKTINTGANFNITPSALTPNGSSITNCYVKPGSPNAGSFPAEASIDPNTCVITSTAAVAMLSTQFTIIAVNSAGASNDATITLNVNAAPTISNIADTSTNEETAKAVSFTIDDVDSTLACNSTYLSISSSNTTIIPNANVVWSGTFPNCTATITPATNQNGTPTLTITTTDSSLTNSDSFILTVSAVNDIPTVGANQTATLNEDTSTTFTLNAGSDVDSGDTLSYILVTAPSSGTISNCMDQPGSSGATDRTCSYSPASNINGSITFTYKINDGTVDSSSNATVTLSVTAVNDVPTVGADQTVTFNEDNATTFTLTSGSDTEGSTLSYTLVSGPASGSLTNCMDQAGSSGSTDRTCSYTPASNVNGSVTFTYNVNDGTNDSATNATITLSITAVNDTPTISDISNTSTNEDAAVAVTFAITDVETTLLCNSTYLSMSTSNTTIVPNNNVVWSGTAASCIGTITPGTSQYGAPTITITVTDTALTASDTFVLTINQLGDDALSSIWPFDLGTTASYSFDSNLVEFSGGVARLKSIDQTDDDYTSSGFSGATATGVAWDSTNSYIRLSQTGTPTNNAELDSSWTPSWSNLIAYWKANNDWVDSINGNNGTTVGGATFISSSKLGSYAGIFDGTNDYVSIPAFTTNTSVTSFSVSVWVYVSAHNPSGRTYVLDTRGNGTAAGSGIGIIIDNNGGTTEVHTFVSYDASNYSEFVFPYAGALGNWIQIVFTRTGSTFTTYLNGIATTPSATYGTGLQSAALSMANAGRIGTYAAQNSTGNFWMNGKVDDLAIWNTNIVAADVKNIYERQSAKYAGTITSRLMDSGVTGSSWSTIAWTPTLPFLKALPDYASGSIQNETTTNYSSLTNNGLTNNLMNGIKALWHFDESSWNGTVNEVIDSSGNGNHGKAMGGITTTTFGKFRNAGNFTGASKYVEITNGFNSTVRGDDTYTISIWARANTFGTNILFETRAVLDLCLEYNTTVGFYWCSGNSYRTYTGMTLKSGEWYNIVIVKTATGDNGKLFLNGVLQSTYTGTLGSSSSTVQNFDIGAQVGNSSRYHDGLIDEVAIWDRPLGDGTSGTQNEIMQLYRRGVNRIKYQVRTCVSDPCNESTETWKGPDNTNQTYYSELFNMSTQAANPSGTVNPGLPTMTFSNFTSLTSRKYFQYRAILESDDSGVGCNYGSGATWCTPEIKSVTAGSPHYAQNTDGSPPTIANLAGDTFFTLATMSETLGGNGCAGGAKYIISHNNSTWYYWNGSAWTSSDGTYSQSSTASVINTNLSSYKTQIGSGSLYWKAFLESSGLQACEIDNLSFTGGN